MKLSMVSILFVLLISAGCESPHETMAKKKAPVKKAPEPEQKSSNAPVIDVDYTPSKPVVKKTEKPADESPPAEKVIDPKSVKTPDGVTIERGNGKETVADQPKPQKKGKRYSIKELKAFSDKATVPEVEEIMGSSEISSSGKGRRIKYTITVSITATSLKKFPGKATVARLIFFDDTMQKAVRIERKHFDRKALVDNTIKFSLPVPGNITKKLDKIRVAIEYTTGKDAWILSLNPRMEK
ncbi:hypothetical protein KKF34_04630 [Myxococcota bacterium]|nr:hypothetical protein [Myxococcota bacterium]MBU1380205.1 hypothetical protein [Myxococcota bacterium]MBU1496145.1 hypothetical protein [Myxococcota bacterium]